MKRLQDKENVVAPDANDIYGSLKDDTGAHDGTYADTEMLKDSLVFFERLMEKSGITPNGLDDNESNGFQLYQAFRKVTRPYNVFSALVSQSGTSAPVVTVLENTTGAIFTAVRVGAGIYRFNASDDVIILGQTSLNIGTLTNPLRGSAGSIPDENYFDVNTTDDSDLFADDVLSSTLIEIKIYD